MLGVTFLFWGAMCDRPFIGLLCALFVEARHWVKLRWDFDDSAYEAAWKITTVLILFSGVVIWLDETRYLAVLVLMTWLPPLLLPLQFVQSYGMKDSMDLASLSMLAKRSRIRNLRLGLITNPVRMNFGNILLVVALLASTVGVKRDTPLFLPGMVVLTGWMLWSTRRCRPGILVPVLVFAGILGLAGEFGLSKFEHYLRWGRHGDSNYFDPTFHSTSIGERGRLALSQDVVWRMKVSEGTKPPLLLRTSTFTNYIGVSWQSHRKRFEEIDTSLIANDSYHLILEDIDTARVSGLPHYSLRGTISGAYPLPLSIDAVAVRGLAAEKVEHNGLGVLKVSPSQPVVDCAVMRMGGSNQEPAPDIADVLQLTHYELIAIEQVVSDLGLRQLPDLESKLKVLRQWFNTQFRYTLDLTIRQPSHDERTGDNPKPTALTQFLTEVRAGHCEYFATAATLILREAGVGSRYAVGFAVVESDSAGGYVIRSSHRHAWCRVWDERNARWLDFDPTPPDWFGVLPQEPPWMQRFKDAIKSIREDFYLWRTNPTNERILMAVIGCIGLVLGIWILNRLWRSRNRIEDKVFGVGSWSGTTVTTPLNALERLLSRHLGMRPVGQPYSEWVHGLQSRIHDQRLLDEVITLHQQMRYDPQPFPDGSRDRLEELAAALEAELRALSTTDAVDHGQHIGG